MQKSTREGLWPHIEGADQCQWRFDFESRIWVHDSQVTAQWPAFDREANPNASDLVIRRQIAQGAPLKQRTAACTSAGNNGKLFFDAAVKGAEFYASMCVDGCLPNDYGGPLFLLPGLVIALYICKQSKQARAELDSWRVWDEPHRASMARYIINHQQADGGWGTHVAGPATNFGSTLNYAALRLLGCPANHPACIKGRAFLNKRGGALRTPLWAKVWLSVLGAAEWDGVNPVPPEMWSLPNWFPFHPGKMWCHARLVALPMSWLYGKRFVYDQANWDPVVLALREELYPGAKYSEIRWSSTRDWLDPVDEYGTQGTFILKAGNILLSGLYEPLSGVLPFRTKALAEVELQLMAEDISTQYVCIGPVNKALNLLCAFARKDDNAFAQHMATVERYLWVSEDGLKMSGYLNSMVWDASFAVLATNAVIEAANGPTHILDKFLAESKAFLLANQVDSDPDQGRRFYRDGTKGGWGFSTKENTYIVSDCTAEALKAMLAGTQQALPTLDYAVDVILAMQNDDDEAWSSYEKRRAGAWYEWLNPAMVFGDIMVDYSYTECTSSCMQALAAYAAVATDKDRKERALHAIACGTDYLLSVQRPDGSWLGKWGVCFTYGTWFACEALKASGDPRAAKAIERACYYLVAKQNDDGGWGESAQSCVEKQYVRTPSTVVQTAWAVLTLCSCPNAIFSPSIAKACELLVKRQTEQGDWPLQEGMYGVFNQTCGVTYTSYRNVFPTWALAKAATRA